MRLDRARMTDDPCRRPHALVGLEQFCSARLRVGNEVVREAIEASNDLPYKLRGLLRRDVSVGRYVDKRPRARVIQPRRLLRRAPEGEQPAFLGDLGPDTVSPALGDLESVPDHQKGRAETHGASAYRSAA